MAEWAEQVGRLVELENLSQHNLVPVEDDGGSRQKNVMLNTHGISWFIFRGGWRGGRLDICKMGYRFRTRFRLLNSLLHRDGDVII